MNGLIILYIFICSIIYLITSIIIIVYFYLFHSENINFVVVVVL